MTWLKKIALGKHIQQEYSITAKWNIGEMHWGKNRKEKVTHTKSTAISLLWLFSHAQFSLTPWTAACQGSLSFTISWSLPKFMFIASVMLSSHLILWCPLLLLPSIFPSTRDFSNELSLHITWPKYWSFSFSSSPSNEHSGLIPFKNDWFDSLGIQGAFRSFLQYHSSEGDQPWDFFGRNDAKAETPVLWPPHAKSWLIEKDSDAGRDWGQEEKGTIEDEMAGWHHWLDGRESGWTLGVGDGQGGLACCSSWGCKESDTTERLNWTELNYLALCVYIFVLSSLFN